MDEVAEAPSRRVHVARAATAHHVQAASPILDEREAALLLARRNGVEIHPVQGGADRDGRGEPVMGVAIPLYEAKAGLFRTLGHPVRIQVLELLQDGPMPVRDLLAQIGGERSSLSQQLAVLRRSGIVTAVRDGDTVIYALAGGDVADLMRAARRILTALLTGRQDLLATLREAEKNEVAKST